MHTYAHTREGEHDARACGYIPLQPHVGACGDKPSTQAQCTEGVDLSGDANDTAGQTLLACLTLITRTAIIITHSRCLLTWTLGACGTRLTEQRETVAHTVLLVGGWMLVPLTDSEYFHCLFCVLYCFVVFLGFLFEATVLKSTTFTDVIYAPCCLVLAVRLVLCCGQAKYVPGWQ